MYVTYTDGATSHSSKEGRALYIIWPAAVYSSFPPILMNSYSVTETANYEKARHAFAR